MNELLLSYLPLVIFMGVALVIAVALLLVPFLLAYKQPDPEKLSAYECGFNAFDDARMPFDVRFYLVAILFIIFDLEELSVSVGGRVWRPWGLRLLVDDGVSWRSHRRLHI